MNLEHQIVGLVQSVTTFQPAVLQVYLFIMVGYTNLPVHNGDVYQPTCSQWLR